MIAVLSDDDLLDFDSSGIVEYAREHTERLLDGAYGDLYRSHLLIARWIDR